MVTTRRLRNVLSRFSGLALLMFLAGLIGTSAASAHQLPSAMTQTQALDAVPEGYVVVDNKTIVDIHDPATGEFLAEGTLSGEVKCNEFKCSRKLYVIFEPPGSTTLEFRATTRLAIDPESRRIVAGGEGTGGSGNSKVKFSYTATYQDIGAGMVEISILSSSPQFSFYVPAVPATMAIFTRR